jgi:peptidoglycan LD-endopeptidase LytH
MNIYKEVNWFFFMCTLLMAGGEIHRRFKMEHSTLTQPLTLASSQPGKILSGSGLLFPVPNKSRQHLIGKFGEPRGKNGTRIHEGIDIAAQRGTHVIAVAKGEVIKVKEGGNGGKQVWVKDLNRDWTYYYAHLHRQNVEEGQMVEEGDQLGTVGSTGNAPENTPHLHFCIYKPGMEAIDPLTVLP